MKTIHAFTVGALLLGAAPLAAQPAPTGTRILQPVDQAEAESSAGVQMVTNLPRALPDAHLFGVAGGDPAMNGLQTYLAFYESPAEGHRTFRLGDFLNYAVLSHGPNQVVLSVRENFMDRNDAIGLRWRRLTITWEGQQVPRRISVTSVPGR